MSKIQWLGTPISTPRFESCFNPSILAELEPTLPRTYSVMSELAPWRRGRWPMMIRCMDERRILEDRTRGAGHGRTYPGGNDVWLNPRMTLPGHWLVLVHENLHHAFPWATEWDLNNALVPWVYERVFGEKMDASWARQHMGDRGFVR